MIKALATIENAIGEISLPAEIILEDEIWSFQERIKAEYAAAGDAVTFRFLSA